MMKVSDLTENMVLIVRASMDDDSNFELSDKVLWHVLEHYAVAISDIIARIDKIEGSCPKINMDLKMMVEKLTKRVEAKTILDMAKKRRSNNKKRLAKSNQVIND
jgi:GTP-binding protein EngB required for normal cell division